MTGQSFGDMVGISPGEPPCEENDREDYKHGET
jgi:hypothetical protein